MAYRLAATICTTFCTKLSVNKGESCEICGCAAEYCQQVADMNGVAGGFQNEPAGGANFSIT